MLRSGPPLMMMGIVLVVAPLLVVPSAGPRSIPLVVCRDKPITFVQAVLQMSDDKMVGRKSVVNQI